MRPLVLAPQMKNVPESSQKSSFRAAANSVRTATAAGFPFDGAGATASVAPYGSAPTASGDSRTSRSATTTATAAATATMRTDQRQPSLSATLASMGKKSS